jgi:alpha-L-rhamnosidase
MRSRSGLIEGPASAWNFVDWVPTWKNGVPPDGDYGASCVINWQFVYALRLAKALEDGSGEVELAARCDRIAREIAAEIQAQFWEPMRGLFADDRDKLHFSEHAQCLAILSGYLDDEQCAQVGNGLLTSHELARTTIYFTHYLFEAYRVLAEESGISADPQAALFDRLSFWFDLQAQGLVTPLEEPEPSRSDCHGWGSHPLFHYLATVLGVRPAAPGFTSVEIRPCLGKLNHVQGKVPHPSGGFVEVELTRQGKEVIATIILPDRVTGILHLADRTTSLKSGRNDVGAVPT